MIAGVPTAVANNTTMPEIAGDAAETFDPYDPGDMSRSMERILTDRNLRETLIARGLERVKRYSWREAAEATLAVCAVSALHEDARKRIRHSNLTRQSSTPNLLKPERRDASAGP